MQNLKRALPPLDPLVAFEAASRLLSFTGAAHELGLTQAAVSQQIRQLEDRLGVKLFDRAHRSVTLTAQGRAFQHSVSAALRHLAGATADVRADRQLPSLTIAADHAIASLWLMPRLERFRALLPDLQVRLVVSDDEAVALAGDIDAALVHGAGDWPGFSARQLKPELIYPVCSPDYLARAGQPDVVADLAAHALLEQDDERWDWMNWRTWLSANEIDLASATRQLRVTTYPLLIDAARRGHGIALGWALLVDDDLAAGDLVRPVGAELATDFGYYVIHRDRGEPSLELATFLDWVVAEADGG